MSGFGAELPAPSPSVIIDLRANFRGKTQRQFTPQVRSSKR